MEQGQPGRDCDACGLAWRVAPDLFRPILRPSPRLRNAATVGTKYTTASAINFGFTNNALGAPGNSLWAWDDVNVLEIQMQLGALEGDTMLDVLNGANALIVGSEILQFTNAVENSPGVYTDFRFK